MQQFERRGALELGHHRRLRLPVPRHPLSDQRILPQFQVQEHVSQVLLERGFLHEQFGGRLLQEGAPRARRVEVQCVHVHQLAALDQQVHFEPLAAELFLQAPHAPVPIVKRVGQLVVALRGSGLDHGNDS